MKLNSVIGFDFRKGVFVIGTHDLKGSERKGNGVEASYTTSQVDQLLAQIAGSGEKEQHEALGAQIVEPIEQVVPYIELWGMFFQDMTIGELDDNAIPVEDTVAIAFETHQDSAVLFVASGFYWTRPGFTTWDTGIEVRWEMLKKAGWNFLARQMRRATEALARKRDALAKNVLDAAILATHTYQVSGGKLTKTSVDAILKAQAAIGFPVAKALVNTGTIMDMATFTWPTGMLLPPEEARQIIKNLYIGNYGGAEWFMNPFAPTDQVYFGGQPNQIGWHQIKGSVKQASDVDIKNKVDYHAIYDAEHAYYVGSALTLAKLTITA